MSKQQEPQDERLAVEPVELPQLTKQQVLAAGGTLAVSTLIDMAAHFNPAVTLTGLFAAYAIFRLSSPDVVGMFVPGSNPDDIRDITARVVDSLTPDEQAEYYKDQSPIAKLRRLAGLQPAPVARPKEDRTVHGEYSDETEGDNTRRDDHVNLGPCLRPHARDILSKRIGMFGIPGSGKSNGLTVFLEELGKLQGIGVPFVLADTEGEYDALRSSKYLMRPYQAGAHNVVPGTAEAFGQSVLERGRQVILNLQSYESDDEAALVMIGIIKGMRAWSEARDNDDRATCMFILDEAAFWLPQRQEESMLSKYKPENGMTLLARLQQAFFGTVVRRGRKRGIGFLFATQRPADLDKRCISCDWLILFRQTFPNDLAKYAELGIPKDAAQALAPGEAFVIDPQGNAAVQQFRERTSPDHSKSPGLSSLKKHAARWATPDEGEDTSGEMDVRATQRGNEGSRDVRNSVSIPFSTASKSSFDEATDGTRNGRKGDTASAPENAVHASMEGVTVLPSGWTEEKVIMLQGFYRVLQNIDKCLEALDLSTSQRNRDFARDTLKR